MRCLAFLVSILVLTATAGARDFRVKIWGYTAGISAERAEKVLAAASAALTQVDPPDDTECPTTFDLTVGVTDGSRDGLPIESASKDDMDRFASDGRFSIYIVRKISWCGRLLTPEEESRGQVFFGCTYRNTGPTLLSIGAFNERDLAGLVTAHEFGHAQGQHDSNTRGLIMYKQAMRDSLRVTPPHCDSFSQPQAFPALALDQPRIAEAEVQLDGAEDGPPLGLNELLESYWHVYPADSIAMLGEADLERVREILAGDPDPRWRNAVTILGERGTPGDLPLIERVIAAAAAVPEAEIVSSPVPYVEILANSQLALGLMYRNTQAPEALSAIYGQMIAPDSTPPGEGVDIVRLNDLATNAALAFGIAGESAAAVYPDAVLQGRIASLLRNGIADADSPVGALDLGTLITTDNADAGILATDTVSEALGKLDLRRGGLDVPDGYRPQIDFNDLLDLSQALPGPLNRLDIGNFYDRIELGGGLVLDR